MFFNVDLVAPVHAVNSHKASPAVRAWRLAHADGIAHRMGLGKTHPQTLMASTSAKVVKVLR